MTLSGYRYLCSAGETFDIVALEVYGDEKYSCELLAANPLLAAVPIFKGGETLALPVVEVPGDEDENGLAGSSAPWKE